MSDKELADMLWEWVANSVGPESSGLNHGLIKDAEGKITMIAIDLPPDAAYRYMISEAVRLKAKEMIFGLDRYAKPGQQLLYNDLIAGQQFLECGADGKPQWRHFIIEYRGEPKIVEPINFDHPVWTPILKIELVNTLRQMVLGGFPPEAG